MLRTAGRHIPLTLAVVVLAAVVIFGLVPALSSGALNQNILLGAAAPGTDGHVFGTDALGRDILQLTVAGARSALVGPIVVAFCAMLMGLVFGLSAAYFGGWWDVVVSRVIEILLSLPSLLLAIVVAGVMGGGYWTNVLVFVVLYAPYDIRLVRSAALARMNDPFIDAAKMLELGPVRIISRHLFPVVRSLVAANVFLDVSNAIVSLSSLSFLGLGVSPQDADWGRQLSDARTLLFTNPMAAVVPGVAIILTSVAFNVIGDWITERSGVNEE